jgi:hypothetical protein
VGKAKKHVHVMAKTIMPATTPPKILANIVVASIGGVKHSGHTVPGEKPANLTKVCPSPGNSVAGVHWPKAA